MEHEGGVSAAGSVPLAELDGTPDPSPYDADHVELHVDTWHDGDRGGGDATWVTWDGESDEPTSDARYGTWYEFDLAPR